MANNSKLKTVKHGFDKITSAHSTNWKLVFVWIIVFEIIASLIEFLNIESSSKYTIKIEHTLTTEIILGISVTLFIWFCVYNIIFTNKVYINRLLFIGVIASYFILTGDFTLGFLLQNLNPLHFFDLEFGLIFIIEIVLKLVILYLIYQFVKTLKNNNVIKDG